MSNPLRIAASLGLLLLVRPSAWAARAIREEAGAGQPQTSIQEEYQLKASYLSRLPAFITWPAASGPKDRQLVIGVVGDSPFERYLDDLFAPGKPQLRPARLVYLRSRQAIEACDVLFICESESDHLFEILRRIKGRPILTIGDSPDFGRRGVMINLTLDRNRIGLEVNLAVLRLAGLEASPQMLKLAKIIE